MSVHLIGGGWDPEGTSAVYGPFLDDAGAAPVVATVVLDEGDGLDQFRRWETALRRTGTCEPVPVLVPLGEALAVDRLADADAVLVCGGLTPGYAEALAPAAGALATWLADGDRPYAGFSAGACVAATQALVGGWRHRGVQVCPEEAAEDLEDVTVVPGLALVPWLVDVHCAQWGTLPRLVAAAQSTGVAGVAIDEDTALHVRGDAVRVAGRGAVRRVTPRDGGVGLETLHAGASLSLD